LSPTNFLLEISSPWHDMCMLEIPRPVVIWPNYGIEVGNNLCNLWADFAWSSLS